MRKGTGDYDVRSRQERARHEALKELIAAHAEEFAELLTEERTSAGFTKPPRKTPVRSQVDLRDLRSR